MAGQPNTIATVSVTDTIILALTVQLDGEEDCTYVRTYVGYIGISLFLTYLCLFAIATKIFSHLTYLDQKELEYSKLCYRAKDTDYYSINWFTQAKAKRNFVLLRQQSLNLL